MALSNEKKAKARELLAEDMSTQDVSRKLRIPRASVAAIKANMSRSDTPKFFEVSATYLVESTSRDEAIATFRPGRLRGVKVIESTIDGVHRLANTDERLSN